MILFGSSLFLIYALPQDGAGSGAELGWPRKVLAWSAGVVLAASVVGLLAHTSILAGSIREGMTAASLSAVMTTMSMGPSTLIRASAAALALVSLARRVSRGTWWLCASLGAVISASFAWMGHGAATEGALGLLHLSADILHTLAAGVWIGALVAFFLLLRPRPPSVILDAVLHKALHGFSGVGTCLVAVIVATGLVNSWFLDNTVWPTAFAEARAVRQHAGACRRQPLPSDASAGRGHRWGSLKGSRARRAAPQPALRDSSFHSGAGPGGLARHVGPGLRRLVGASVVLGR